LLVGGDVGPQGAVFGRDLGLIPARRAPQAVLRLLEWADLHKLDSQTPGAALRSANPEALKAVLADLVDLDSASTELDFWDVGATEAFLGDTTGEGECAA
jgi:hypothetical protein